MNHPLIKKVLPHLIAVVIFLIVALLYCKPVIDGKKLRAHDTQGWKGMAQQSFEVKAKTGKFPLWTNSMFGGMPTYQIALDGGSDIGKGLSFLDNVLMLGLPIPISFFFLACLCFYILCIIAKVNPWLSILGAIAYAYSTYDPVIISAGHNTKMMSIAIAPMLFAGLLLLFQRKYLIGLTVTAFFTSFLIGQNHLQIVYYTLIMLIAMSIAYVIQCYKEKQLPHAFKALGLAALGGIVGLATTAVGIMPTYEYSKETMRGGVSQLTLDKDSTNKTKGGLDKNYALRWSLGKMETFTVMVPGLYGGSNGGDEHSTSAAFVKTLTDLGAPEENALAMVNGYSYWGSMSSPNETTSGPVYMGAIMCFLFIFGLIYLKSWHKWWLIAASVICLLLAWGSNFQAFNYFMLDYLPFYSKFRAPSMAMVMLQFCLPFLGVLSLQQLVSEGVDWKDAFKKLKYAVFATAGVFAIIIAFWVTADYVGKGDADYKEGFKSQLTQAPPNQPVPPEMQAQANTKANELMKALREDRQSRAGKDIARSFLFVVLGVVLVGLFVKKKINAMVLAISLTLLTAIDLFTINNRYLSSNRYIENSDVDEEFVASPTDLQIMNDPDHANFRVFNQTGGFTNESRTSYFHNSIGGYHPAKLGLYQDLIEHQISKGNMQVINMLNTKYFLTPGRDGKPASAQVNPNAFGSCWLVKGIKYVNTINEEMLALDSTNLKDTVVINKQLSGLIKEMPKYDSTASIKVKERQNDKITYDFNATAPQFAVFSEVYYSAGWEAYIDDKRVDYAKVNYALRGLSIPAGKHTIVFKFAPKSYGTGQKITLWSTIMVYLLIAASLFYYFKKERILEKK